MQVRLSCFGAAFLALLSACSTPIGAPTAPAAETSLPTGATRSFSLTGQLTRADHQTYREIPFTVPPGVTRLAIDLTYEGRDQKTVVDLGLRDPDGQRGWSGGNKSHIEVGAADATPSYRPGPLKPGTWLLVLGVPNIRDGVTSSFEAKVRLSADGAPTTAAPISTTPGWRRGDFHTHTAHSDGSCDNGAGVRIPCPVVRTLEAASNARLDFIAITDHNTLTHAQTLRELAPAFPDLLVIAGTEITTFNGHANAIGLSAPISFQLGSARLPDLAALQSEVEAANAILSINHPGQPSGEACMGCGWTVQPTDFSRIAAVEVANGGTLRAGFSEGPVSGIPFWEKQLNQGFHLTAIGGSDNHDATDTTGAKQSPVGKPATVVWSNSLSQPAILAGVRSGRVFIDLQNQPGRLLDMTATVSAGTSISATNMGGTLVLAPGAAATLHVTLEGAPGATLELVSHNLSIIQSDDHKTATIMHAQSNDLSKSGWIRANARDAAGKLIMIGNPIYVTN